ncbi:MAG: gamma-glutamyltranspeptidase / glutathione hydrolase [Baekduia sp.]|jgi:gamma-glutamyltranspeptidase/glutathione hydrolase|nr:gamma-glutamyltranspeptidase / glutathione hydrolase [Baekduia sp.]
MTVTPTSHANPVAWQPRELRAPVARGMVATSQPLAAQAGVEMLEAGGTAADAAVAAAATLCVVEPRATGIGGDAFALCWPAGAAAPDALDGAGPSAAAATLDAIRAAGHAEMPRTGPWTITVPGAVDAWAKLLERHGRLGLAEVLAPAIRHAQDGFAVTPVIAAEWAMHARNIASDEAASATFLPGGRAPSAGEVFRNPAMAELLALVAEGGADAFYRGDPAERIGAAVRRAGGPLRASDLADFAGARWVTPLARAFRGVTVFELPPPGQGIVALEALGIFADARYDDRAAEEHAAIEALKLAFQDANDHLADPLIEPVDVERLLGAEHLAQRRALIGAAAADIAAPGPATDTVYVAAVDGEGGACSLIQSLYSGFGSGVGVPGLGITLQNRGKGFVLDPTHPNRLAPGKRPYHTIIPAMLARGSQFHGCLGVVGGFMQPQGQMQILRHVLDHGLGIGEALAAPRARFLDGRAIGVEPGFDAGVLDGLRSRGHDVGPLSNFGAGGAQAILRDGDELHGASDPRKDGRVVTT